MLSESTSAGRSSVCWRSIVKDRCTASAVSTSPRSSRVISSSNSWAARSTSAWSPVMVISLPRTWMSQVNARSIKRSSSSLEPRRATIECAPGTTILVVAAALPRGLPSVVTIVDHILSRRPAHRTSSDQVQMSVKNGLVSGGAGVGDQPVTVVLYAVGGGDLAGQPHHRDQGVRLGGGDLGQVGVMAVRDHQHMGGRNRGDVPEGHGLVVAGDHVGRD